MPPNSTDIARPSAFLAKEQPSTAADRCFEAAALQAEASVSDVEAAMGRLKAASAEWVDVPLKDKMALLKEINRRLLDNPFGYARECSKVTGNEGNANDFAPQLIKNTMITSTYIKSLVKALSALDKNGSFPKHPERESEDPRCGTILDTTDLTPSMLKSVAPKVETYLQPGAEPKQGSFYSSPHNGRVSVCLGAGNQPFLGIIDVLDRMFVGGDVVWFKYHPVLESTAPFQEHILKPLSARGFYIGNIAGVDVTTAALRHPSVGWMHMTGGLATHDVIVWGSTPEQRVKNKAENSPLLKVPVTSELGCVTPWLVVPGKWSSKDVAHYAKHAAAGFGDNLSCNCLSPKVIILAKGWDCTEEFVRVFKDTMAAYPLLAPYYPGIHARHAKFRAAYPDALALENKPARHVDVQKFGKPLPWVINELELELGAKPSAQWAKEVAFAEEPFAPVITLLQVELPETGADDLADSYMDRVTEFCNLNLFGTLSCTVLVHPKTEQEKGHAVSAMLDGLKYGSVVKNEFSATSYLIPGAHWGGYQSPEINIKDAGSGVGSVWNLGFYENVQKSVVHCQWAAASQAKPPHEMSIPAWIAKAIVGVYVQGIWGLVKMFCFAK